MENNTPDALGLNLNLSGVDTSMPVLEAGHYICRVAEVDVKENKAGTGRNLLCIYETQGPATSVQGRETGKTEDIKPGYKLRAYMPLQQSDNPDAPDFRKGLAQFQDAVERSTMENRSPQFNPFSYIGMEVVVRVDVSKDDVYGLGNNIKGYSIVPE